ncbi:MAG: hypothetical protein KZQ99_08480 [Candidatus Thiodiazotropha sp. (ex Dulcina madagascariensis)]|nr:hypothetical protein [Candidatus Thiodiazotropha sp. (ex Dulcina madagascariensis)]
MEKKRELIHSINRCISEGLPKNKQGLKNGSSSDRAGRTAQSDNHHARNIRGGGTVNERQSPQRTANLSILRINNEMLACYRIKSVYEFPGFTGSDIPRHKW